MIVPPYACDSAKAITPITAANKRIDIGPSIVIVEIFQMKSEPMRRSQFSGSHEDQSQKRSAVIAAAALEA